MDLLKAYNLRHMFFNSISLKLFHSYFSNQMQRVKIGSAISEWIDILNEIPQGSVLGFLIFNIFKHIFITLGEQI